MKHKKTKVMPADPSFQITPEARQWLDKIVEAVKKQPSRTEQEVQSLRPTQGHERVQRTDLVSLCVTVQDEITGTKALSWKVEMRGDTRFYRHVLSCPRCLGVLAHIPGENRKKQLDKQFEPIFGTIPAEDELRFEKLPEPVVN